MLRIRHIGTLDELEAIQPLWRQLHQRDPAASVAQSWEWNKAWCEQVLPVRRKARMAIKLMETEAGEAVAILPFFSEPIAGPMLRLLQFIGHRMPVHHDILLAEPSNRELVQAVIATLRNALDGRTLLHLRRLRENSLFTQQLVHQQLAEAQDSHLWLRNDPTLTDQSKRLGKSKRSTYRWQLNKLQREYGIRFQVCTGEALTEAFEVHDALHSLRWQSQEKASFMVDEHRTFLKAVTQALGQRGGSEILQLWAGDQVIASSLMLLERGRYCGIQSGFDPAFAKFSPMRLLITEAMRRGFMELGCTIFDFGPGFEGYKLDWKPVLGSSYFCCLAGAMPHAKAAALAYRAAFVSRLPASHLKQGRSA